MTANKTLNTAISVVNAAVGRNRIINGDMRIDQRNSGAATANTISGYVVDRWQVLQTTSGKLIAQQNAGSVTPPAGFTNYLGVTSQSAYSVGVNDIYRISQQIEGLNWSDLDWGKSTAKSVTLSFWVRSSLTGTFGGAIGNSAGTRSYPFTYSISSANTWTNIVLTIPGDTSGTYVTDNTSCLYLQFALGLGTNTAGGTAFTWGTSPVGGPSGTVSVVGTNGATFYITGVQLEQGSSATPFERRLYGQELALCQRYYEVLLSHSSGTGFLSYYFAGASDNRYTWLYKVTKRAAATVSLASGGSWGTSTPSIQGGADCATFYSTSYFTVGSTAGTPCIRAAAEL